MNDTSGTEQAARRSRRTSPWLAVVFFVFAAVVLCVLLRPDFGLRCIRGFELCPRCGLIRQSESWSLRWTVFLRTHVILTNTPVGLALARAGLVVEHAHAWVHVDGNVIWPYTSSGLHNRQMQPVMRVIREESVAALLEAAHRYGETELRDRLVRWVSDPTVADAVLVTADETPAMVYATEAAFRAQLPKLTNQLYESVRAQQELGDSTR